MNRVRQTGWSQQRRPHAAPPVHNTTYVGMVAVRETRGREALFLLMLTIFVSDTAQYYTGRAVGRRRLAPAISPNKTVEGAVGGLLFGALVLAVVGRWWLPGPPLLLRILLGFRSREKYCQKQ